MSNQRPEDRFLELDNARLRWRLDGTGPALALLHGWALDLDYWDPLVERLASRFTLLRFDRRGYGLSAGSPDIHSNVADLAALLDAAGIDTAILLGMSQGARLAIHFACRQPGRTHGLMLDGPPVLETETELPLAGLRHLLHTAGAAAMRAAVLALPVMQLQTADPAAHGLLAAILARYPGTDLLRDQAHAQAPDFQSIKAPTLVINGGLDSQSRLDAGYSLATAIPGAQRVTLAGAGHLALLDDPAAYVAAVSAFCGRIFAGPEQARGSP